MKVQDILDLCTRLSAPSFTQRTGSATHIAENGSPFRDWHDRLAALRRGSRLDIDLDQLFQALDVTPLRRDDFQDHPFPLDDIVFKLDLRDVNRASYLDIT